MKILFKLLVKAIRACLSVWSICDHCVGCATGRLYYGRNTGRIAFGVNAPDESNARVDVAPIDFQRERVIRGEAEFGNDVLRYLSY